MKRFNSKKDVFQAFGLDCTLCWKAAVHNEIKDMEMHCDYKAWLSDLLSIIESLFIVTKGKYYITIPQNSASSTSDLYSK